MVWKIKVPILLSITFFFQSTQLRHVSHTLMVVLVTQRETVIVGGSPTASVSVRHIKKTHTKNTFSGNNDINDLHNIQHVRIISISYYLLKKKSYKTIRLILYSVVDQAVWCSRTIEGN